MTAKEWLSRAWKIDDEIDALLSGKSAAYERLTSITAQQSGTVISSTKDPHKAECLLASYAAYDAEIQERVNSLMAIKSEIQETISALADVRYRTLLTYLYINYQPWEQIAVNMSYSYMHICRLHGEALKAIEPLIP